MDIIKSGNVRRYFSARKNYQEYGKKDDFPHYLSIAAIAKDEGRYFPEWVEFHRLMGVEKFYIYDNESTDNTRKILQPYIEEGIVEYTYFPGEAVQLAAYHDAISVCKQKTKWLALVDLDEFIVPIQHKNIPEVLKNIASVNEDISQILIGWIVYGSSGHQKRPEGLVIENYKNRELDSVCCKCIIKPIAFYDIVSSHSSYVYGKTVDERGYEFDARKRRALQHVFPKELIRIHHYQCKSYEDFLEKSSKGSARFGGKKIKDQAYFDACDRNEIFDNIMDQYVAPIKEKMQISFDIQAKKPEK